VRQPKAGLEKRQATVHLTLCADPEAVQPKPIVIFRGQGKNILQSEEALKWVSILLISGWTCQIPARMIEFTSYFNAVPGSTEMSLFRLPNVMPKILLFLSTTHKGHCFVITYPLILIRISVPI
jgi:hypothetical protein